MGGGGDGRLVEVEARQQLGFEVPLDLDVRSRPDGVPFLRVSCQQRVVTRPQRRVYVYHRLLLRVGDVVAAEDGDHLFQRDPLTGFELEGQSAEDAPLLLLDLRLDGLGPVDAQPCDDIYADAELDGLCLHADELSLREGGVGAEVLAVKAPDLPVDAGHDLHPPGFLRGEGVAHGQQVDVGVAGELLYSQLYSPAGRASPRQRAVIAALP